MKSQVQLLWNEFHDKLRGFIKSRVKDEDTTSDILQDVFLKIQLNISKLKDGTKLTSWVYQITRNAIFDYFRKNKPLKEIDTIDLEEIEFEKNYNEIFQNDLRYFINELPDKYKEALILTEYQGMNQIQLADYFGISYSGAKSRVQRAKEKLKELFIDCCNIQSDSFGNIINYQKKRSGSKRNT